RGRATSEPAPPWDDEPPAEDGPPWDVEPPRDDPAAQPGQSGSSPAPRLRVPQGSRPRSGGRGRDSSPPATASAEEIDDTDPDDPELASSGLLGAPLVAQMLGGTVIDEIPEDRA